MIPLDEFMDYMDSFFTEEENEKMKKEVEEELKRDGLLPDKLVSSNEKKADLKEKSEMNKLEKIFEDITGHNLVEYVSDTKVDNLAEELKRSTEIELNMFAAGLLNTTFNSFLQSYTMPQFEGFKTVICSIVDRFRVMDDAEKLDLFQKIELMFKELLTKNFGALGPEQAELIASRYSKQMIQFLKDKNTDPQSATDTLYPHRRDINGKAEPIADTEPWQAKVQAKMQVADLTNDDAIDALILNPY